MKKMFLGAMLFISGFIGILVLVIISIFKPWNYNGIEGFGGFLLGTDIVIFFIIYCILAITGLALCLTETFPKNYHKEKMFKIVKEAIAEIKPLSLLPNVTKGEIDSASRKIAGQISIYKTIEETADIIATALSEVFNEYFDVMDCMSTAEKIYKAM